MRETPFNKHFPLFKPYPDILAPAEYATLYSAGAGGCDPPSICLRLPLKTSGPRQQSFFPPVESATMRAMDRFFGISAQGSTVRIELVAGVTTFLTMAYIMFLNPLILADAGWIRGRCSSPPPGFGPRDPDHGALCQLSHRAGTGHGDQCLLHLWGGDRLHYSWQAALGAVFISGILFLILSLTPLREWIIGGIPKSQKMAIAAGIGLFLGILA